MKSSPKKSRPSTSSPSKSSPQKIISGAEVEALQEEIQKLQFTLGNRDIEIERMETTLVALNHKLEALQDVRTEANQYRKQVTTTENERGNQQTVLIELSKKVKIEAETHESKHDQSR